jgi:hypothetical protein
MAGHVRRLLAPDLVDISKRAQLRGSAGILRLERCRCTRKGLRIMSLEPHRV